LEIEEAKTKIKELEGAIESLNATITEKDERIKELEAPETEPETESTEIKELGVRIDTLVEESTAKDEQIKELAEKLTVIEDIEARIKKLEDAPDPITTVAGSSGAAYVSNVIRKANGDITRRDH